MSFMLVFYGKWETGKTLMPIEKPGFRASLPEGSPLMCPITTVNVEELFIDQNTRNVDKLKSLFLPYEVDAIIRVPITGANHQDAKFWRFEKKGTYSVKSGYWNSL